MFLGAAFFRISTAWKKTAAAALVWAATSLHVFGHDPGLSSANAEITSHGVTLTLTFNERDLAGLLGNSAEELRAPRSQEKLENTAQRAVRFNVNGGSVSPAAVGVHIDESNNVEFRYSFPVSASPSEISFDSILLKELSFGHRQAFAARNAAGIEIARQMLSGRESVAMIPLERTLESTRRGTRFLEFLLLGIRHILTGYDHLLFLFGLLVVCRNPRSALLLITCFTVAHSLTLALSTFGLVNLPSRFVEATIAASILYVGIENLARRDGLLRGRWLLTSAFGLIHGLGFASVLQEMGIARSGMAAVVPLVAFNSGVEVGQLAVAAILLPLIWSLRQRPGFLRLGVPACSFAVAVAGGYWLLERTVLS